MKATALQPLLDGHPRLPALMGIILTLPISSAAICAGLGLVGLPAAPALLVALLTWSASLLRPPTVRTACRVSLSQGLGTSMLQVPNLVKKNPSSGRLVVASIVNGPLATCLFKLQMNGGRHQLRHGHLRPLRPDRPHHRLGGPLCEENAALGVDFAAATASPALNWIGLVVCSFVIPALVSWLVSELMRKKGLIKEGDYALDL